MGNGYNIKLCGYRIRMNKFGFFCIKIENVFVCGKKKYVRHFCLHRWCRVVMVTDARFSDSLNASASRRRSTGTSKLKVHIEADYVLELNRIYCSELCSASK